ncbi:MAG: hypothetical protein HY860_00285 [Chlamydiales bacterium]|nr:hypothetical protein [Chlamydiales bacterium]
MIKKPINILIFFLLIGCTIKQPTKSDITSFSADKEKLLLLNDLHFRWHLQSDGGLYTIHQSVNQYVEKVGNRLAKLSEVPHAAYEFRIIRNRLPHAISFLDGKIAINTGILFLIENEAELAALIAQNIACSKYLYDRLDPYHPNLFAENEQNLKLHFLNDFTYSPFPLDTELELDNYAIHILIQAGYDPSALLTLHNKLAKAANDFGPHKGLSIHPFSKMRIIHTEELLQHHEKGGYLGENAYQHAIVPLKKLEKAVVLYQQGSQSLLEKKGQQALDFANAAVAIESHEPKFQLLRAKALRLCNKTDEALKAFNLSLQLDSNYYETYLERGKLFYQIDDYDEAIADFNHCLTLVPSSSAHYYLAKIYEKLGKLDKAIFYYTEIANTNTAYGCQANKALRAIAQEKLSTLQQ